MSFIRGSTVHYSCPIHTQMLLTAHTVLDIRAIMTFIVIVSSCGNHLTHTHRPHWSEADTGYASADSSPHGAMVSPYLYTA